MSPRKDAIEQGDRIYHGKPCKRCGKTEKYTSISTCTNCINSERAKGHQRENYYRSERFLNHVKNGTSRLMKPAVSRKVGREKTLQKFRINKYGLTEEQHQKMFDNQNYRCATCGRHQNELPKKLSIDHCHNSGKVRGLLCNNCNVALGFVRDSVATLENMIKYLKN